MPPWHLWPRSLLMRRRTGVSKLPSVYLSDFLSIPVPNATLCTIDLKLNYVGVDVRKNIANELRAKVNKTGARVVDLCCGVGMSTRALESAFHDGELVVG